MQSVLQTSTASFSSLFTPDSSNLPKQTLLDYGDALLVEEPEEVKQAWDELVLIQKEQERYQGIKLDLQQDLGDCKKSGKRLEDVSTSGNLYLGCQVFQFMKRVFQIYR